MYLPLRNLSNSKSPFLEKHQEWIDQKITLPAATVPRSSEVDQVKYFEN